MNGKEFQTYFPHNMVRTDRKMDITKPYLLPGEPDRAHQSEE
jgi:hypothetical protein